MAEGFLKSFNSDLMVVSAGTNPSDAVHPKAIEVMNQINIDLSESRPTHVNDFLNQSFDYVITVCGGAKESCPAFTGKVTHNMHIGFDDPADATGTEEQIISEFIRIRDEIKRDFYKFYIDNIGIK